jgi:hypothetical protein
MFQQLPTIILNELMKWCAVACEYSIAVEPKFQLHVQPGHYFLFLLTFPLLANVVAPPLRP